MSNDDHIALERNRLLDSMTEDVGQLVLRGNDMQGQALSVAESTAADMLPEHAHVIRALERAAGLDRVWVLVSPGNPLKPQAGIGWPLNMPTRSS